MNPMKYVLPPSNPRRITYCQYRGCSKHTNHSKPYCTKHTLSGRYASRVYRDLRAREQLEASTKPLKRSDSLVQDVETALLDGPKSARRIRSLTKIPLGRVEDALKLLERSGLVRLWQSKRGYLMAELQ